MLGINIGEVKENGPDNSSNRSVRYASSVNPVKQPLLAVITFLETRKRAHPVSKNASRKEEEENKAVVVVVKSRKDTATYERAYRYVDLAELFNDDDVQRAMHNAMEESQREIQHRKKDADEKRATRTQTNSKDAKQNTTNMQRTTTMRKKPSMNKEDEKFNDEDAKRKKEQKYKDKDEKDKKGASTQTKQQGNGKYDKFFLATESKNAILKCLEVLDKVCVVTSAQHVGTIPKYLVIPRQNRSIWTNRSYSDLKLPSHKPQPENTKKEQNLVVFMWYAALLYCGAHFVFYVIMYIKSCYDCKLYLSTRDSSDNQSVKQLLLFVYFAMLGYVMHGAEPTFNFPTKIPSTFHFKLNAYGFTVLLVGLLLLLAVDVAEVGIFATQLFDPPDEMTREADVLYHAVTYAYLANAGVHIAVAMYFLYFTGSSGEKRGCTRFKTAINVIAQNTTTTAKVVLFALFLMLMVMDLLDTDFLIPNQHHKTHTKLALPFIILIMISDALNAICAYILAHVVVLLEDQTQRRRRSCCGCVTKAQCVRKMYVVVHATAFWLWVTNYAFACYKSDQILLTRNENNNMGILSLTVMSFEAVLVDVVLQRNRHLHVELELESI